MTTAYHGRGPLTRRTGASRGLLSAAGWASPSGTAAASCRPAGAGVERRCATLAAVRLPLLLEETGGMLETNPPSGSAGRTLRTRSFWGWSTHRRPGLRLRDCATSRVASGSLALPCCQGSGRSRAVCGVAGRRSSQAKASRSRIQGGGKATGSSMEEGRGTGQHEQTSSKDPT